MTVIPVCVNINDKTYKDYAEISSGAFLDMIAAGGVPSSSQPALSAILIYGGIMNAASALMWAGEINGKTILSYYISGFPMDCVHAAATWLFLWFAAEPMLEKLDRIKVKYGLVE